MPNKLEIIINADGTRAIKSLKEVAATAAATGKETAQAAKLAELARKFEAETITSTSVKIIQARRNETAAASDHRKVLQQIRDGALSEAEGVTLEAAAYQKLAAARLRAAEAAKVETSGGLSSVFRERLTEHLGEFGITESMAGMTAAVVGGVAVLGELANKMREVVSEALEFGEAMQHASEKTGLSVETLSVLRYAAKTTGGDFDSMTAAVAKMDKTIGEATEGNKKAQAFLKQLGLNARELADDPNGAEVAFRRLAAAVSDTENPIRKNEVATGILNRAGAEQIPLLMQIGNNWDALKEKAEAAGMVLSTKTAVQLEEANRRLKETKQSLEGAGLAFTEGFIPSFLQMLSVITGGKSQMDSLQEFGGMVGRGLAGAAAAAYSLAAGLARVFEVQNLGTITPAGRWFSQAAGDMDAKAKAMTDIAMGRAAPASPNAGSEKKPSGVPFTGVGDLTHTPDKAAQERLRAMELELDNEKRQFGMTLKSELAFWDARIDQFDKKSAEYKTISDKETAIAVAGANASAALIRRFKEQQLREEVSGDRELQEAMKQGSQAMRAITKDRYEGQEEQRKGAERVFLEQMGGQDRIHEFQLSMGTAGDYARGVAAMHEASAQRQMQSLSDDRVKAMQNPYLDEQQRQRQLAAIDEQIERLRQSTELQALEDDKRIESTTLLGGANDALRQFIQESTDAGAAMKQLVTGSLNVTNEAIVRAMTGGKADFGAAGHEIFTNATAAMLKSAEGNLMKALGLGGSVKKDGSSEAAALWVRIAQTADGTTGSIPAIPGMTDGMDTLSSVLGSLIHGGKGSSDDGGDNSSSGVVGFLSKMLGGGTQGGAHGTPPFVQRLAGGDGSSPATPIYVKSVDGPAGTGGFGSLFSHKGSSSSDSGSGGGFWSFIGGLFGGGGVSAHDSDGNSSGLFGADSEFPGFAAGTDFAPGGMALVGERGPELVNLPRGASVTPNHRLGTGDGDTHHTWNIDARGASDPAAVRAQVMQGIREATPHIVAASVGANRDLRNRMPSAAR